MSVGNSRLDHEWAKILNKGMSREDLYEYDAAVRSLSTDLDIFYAGEMNRVKYIAQLANLDHYPTLQEWEEIQKIACVLAKDAVVNVIEGKDISNPLTTKKICDMLRPTNSASASDTAQCSPH